MTDVAVDACCLINLLAADCLNTGPLRQTQESPRSEVSTLGLKLHIPSIVASETLYLLQPDEADSSNLVKLPIDISRHFNFGIFHRCEILNGNETAYFVGFANKLDDGEAACMAVAKNRSWHLATDDRLAAKLAGQVGVTVLTTAEILKRWAVNTNAPRHEIEAALRRVRRFAKFIPRPGASEASWWLSHL